MPGKRLRRVGVLTGGGDCPGLNAVIRAVSKTLMHGQGAEVVGFLDGYEGLVLDRTMPLDWAAVSDILTLGGTILGTSNTANPFQWAQKRRGGKVRIVDRSAKARAVFRKHRLDGLVVIGGDGSMAVAGGLLRMGIPVLGVPKTIDNDVMRTEQTFGFRARWRSRRTRWTACTRRPARIIGSWSRRSWAGTPGGWRCTPGSRAGPTSS
jgi:6-phosphofructokinase 1